MKEINISSVIAAKRREKGITQDELAEYIGVSKASVSKWETAQSYPDITLLPQLAAFFNITIDDLMGYLPQMTKEDIKKNYSRLSHDFSCKPFDEVYEECRGIIKKYYSCFPLLFQMAVLFTNHYMLAKEKEKQDEILNEIVSLCVHIKKESDDVWLAKQANSIEAISYLVQQKPLEVLELMDETIKPILGDEIILSSAYQMKGNVDKAKSVLQVGIYQYIAHLLGFAPSYLMLHITEVDKIEIILERFLSISKAFDIERLRPDLLTSIYYCAAIAYANQKESDKTLEMLDNYTKVSTSDNFAIALHGDRFFNSLDEWFDELDFNKKAPRDIKVIKADVLKIIKDNPAFEFLENNPKFKNTINTLLLNLNGGNDK